MSARLSCNDFNPCVDWDRLEMGFLRDTSTDKRFLNESGCKIRLRATKALVGGCVVNALAMVGMIFYRCSRVSVCYHCWPIKEEPTDLDLFIRDHSSNGDEPEELSCCDRVTNFFKDAVLCLFGPCGYLAMQSSACFTCINPEGGRKVYASWETLMHDGKFHIDPALLPVSDRGFCHPSEFVRKASISLIRQNSNAGSDGSRSSPSSRQQDGFQNPDLFDDPEPLSPRRRRYSVAVVPAAQRKLQRKRSDSLPGIMGYPRSLLLDPALPQRSYSGGNEELPRSDSPGAVFDGAVMKPNEQLLESFDEDIGSDA